MKIYRMTLSPNSKNINLYIYKVKKDTQKTYQCIDDLGTGRNFRKLELEVVKESTMFKDCFVVYFLDFSKIDFFLERLKDNALKRQLCHQERINNNIINISESELVIKEFKDD